MRQPIRWLIPVFVGACAAISPGFNVDSYTCSQSQVAAILQAQAQAAAGLAAIDDRSQSRLFEFFKSADRIIVKTALGQFQSWISGQSTSVMVHCRDS